MLDWIKVIISPRLTLKIPKEDHHCFQNFVAVTCDFLWSSSNKAYHKDLSFIGRENFKSFIGTYDGLEIYFQTN